MKQVKRIISLVIAVALLVMMVPVGLAVGGGDGDFQIVDGVLISYLGAGGEVVIPDEVSVIGPRAFCPWSIPEGRDPSYGSASLTKVVIHSGVTEIENYAFNGCQGLTQVEWSGTPSVSRIGRGAFGSCGFSSFVIPASVTELGGSAVSGKNLIRVTVEEGNTAYKTSADGKDLLTADRKTLVKHYYTQDEGTVYNVPEGIEIILDNALDGSDTNGSDAYAEIEIHIPRSVVTLPSGVVTNTPGAFSVDPANGHFCAEDGVLFSKDKTELIRSSRKKGNDTYLVPAGVKHLKNSAFFGTGVRSIILPEGLEVVESSALGNNRCEEIEFPASLKRIEADAFNMNSSCHKIVFKSKSVDIEQNGILVYTDENGKINAPDAYAPKGGSVESYCTKNSIPFYDLTSTLKPLAKSMFVVDTTGENYTGSPITKTITSSLTLGTDYIVHYTNNVNVGAATITIAGKGDYFGQIEYTFAIVKKGLSDDGLLEIPSSGFAVQIIGEDGQPIEGVKVTALNIGQDSAKITASDGLAIFPSLPIGEGNMRSAHLEVIKDGYQAASVVRTVDKGGFTAVTIFPDDGNVRITSVVGEIDGARVDLLSEYRYYKENSDGTKEADDGSNTKELKIKIETAGGAQIKKYQLLQGGNIVVESDVSAIRIPVLTGTPKNPNSFGSDWRIAKLKAGEIVYLRVVDSNGAASKRIPLGLKVSKPTLYTAADNKGKLELGEKLKINVPPSIPILGGTEIELGWNELPFIFEVSQSGKVKFAINPKKSLGEGSVDGEFLSDWTNIKKEYNEALEQVLQENTTSAKKFGEVPQKFGAGLLSVSASVMGYGEGYIDKNGNITVDIGLVMTVSEEGSYSWTYFLGYVPVYVSIGEKASLTGKGQLTVGITNKNISISGAVGELNPKLTLNVDGGVGANGILSIGASGRATLAWLNRWTDKYNRVDLTGEMYLVARAFLFKAEKKLAQGTWTIFDSFKETREDSMLSLTEGSDVDFYDANAYKPMERDYLDRPMEQSLGADAVKTNVYPNAAPKFIQVGNTAYLFWIDDIPQRGDKDRTALVYAASSNCEEWSTPIQVIPEENESRAVFAFDACTDGQDVHIALSKANQNFGNEEVTLDQMAASAEMFYIKVNGKTGAVDEIRRITNNSYCDIMPAIAINNDRVEIAFVENQMEDGLFGTSNTYTVNIYGVDVGDITVAAALNKPITELDAGILEGITTVSYVIDTDEDYNTSADKELWIWQQGTPEKLALGNIYTPTFAKVGNDNILLWSAEGNIYYTDGTGEVEKVFDESCPGNLGHSFYVISGNDQGRIIWEATSKAGDANTMAVYAIDYSDGGWSNSYTLFETESELTSALSGYCREDRSFVAYLKSRGVEEEETTAICVSSIKPPTDIAILDVDYKMNDVDPGMVLPMTVTIRNCGATTVDSILIYANSDKIAELNGMNLLRGMTGVYTINSFVVPDQLNGIEALTITATTDGDKNDTNNQIACNLGYTDIQLTANRLFLNGEDWISISVTNMSNIVTDATLRVLSIRIEKKVNYFYEVTTSD